MPRFLMVDDHELFCDGLRLLLTRREVDATVVHVRSAEDALNQVSADSDYDLILLDFHLPDQDGLHLLSRLRQLQPTIPVVLLSGHESPRLATQALAAGASGFIPKSLPTPELLAAVGKVLEGQIYVPVELYQGEPAGNASILANGQIMLLEPGVLDYNPAPVLIFALHDEHHLLYANQAALRQFVSQWTRVAETRLHQCIEDSALLKKLLERPQRELEIPEIQLASRQGGAIWYTLTCAPIEINHQACVALFFTDITPLKLHQQVLSQQAETDLLTRVFNRRGFFRRAEMELERARRFHVPCSLLLMDMDNFKRINDCDGHAMGDELLQQFALHCTQQLRPQDLIGRFGGEEFLVLLVHAEEEKAFQVAERLRMAWQQRAQAFQGQSAHSTVSIGMAQVDDAFTLDQLIRHADEKLYRAKASGRNCTCR